MVRLINRRRVLRHLGVGAVASMVSLLGLTSLASTDGDRLTEPNGERATHYDDHDGEH